MVENRPVIPDAGASRIPDGAVTPPPVNGRDVPSPNSDAIDDDVISAEDFHESFGEDIRVALDVKQWRAGKDLSNEYSRIEREVREAVHHEEELHGEIRTKLFCNGSA